jgi:uncharacterized repeat protein (TIGR02543 family)
MSKKKLTRITVACIIGIIVLVVIATSCGPTLYTLTTNISPSGAGSVSPSGGEYESGMQVTLTAAPASGYTFDYWSGSASGTTSTITITMDSDKSLTAHFKTSSQTYTLTTNVSPSGAGSVSPSGGEYESGAQVTLTASPASGYTFDHWNGSASGTTSTITITMDSDKSLTAHFETAHEILFSDDFSNESSGWLTYDGYKGRVAYLNECLYIKDYTDESTIWSESQHYFTDFILEVETWLVGGTDDNWHSVSCRWEGKENSYDFDISADGYYEIQKWVDDNLTQMVSPTYSLHINQGVGAVNLIHIECIGSSLSLSVNGHLLWEGTDTTFTGGDIALCANALAGTFTEVAFDNIIVTEP